MSEQFRIVSMGESNHGPYVDPITRQCYDLEIEVEGRDEFLNIYVCADTYAWADSLTDDGEGWHSTLTMPGQLRGIVDSWMREGREGSL